MIGVQLDGDRLGSFALVADASTFKKNAGRIEDRGRLLLVADMPTQPIPGHKRSEDLVPIEELARRLGVVARAPLEAIPTAVFRMKTESLASGGEQEFCRRLAMLADCGLFRPFPDNETAEILVRRLMTGTTIGIQVKTCTIAQPNGRGEIFTLRSSFIASPTTFVVALAWIRAERRFHEDALLVPSDVLPTIASADGESYKFHFRPDGSHMPSRLDRYRIPLQSLADALGKHL